MGVQQEREGVAVEPLPPDEIENLDDVEPIEQALQSLELVVVLDQPPNI